MANQLSYRIEARSVPLVLPKVFRTVNISHNYLALRKPSGEVISELHGLATKKNGDLVPIGLIGDKLKFCELRADVSGAGSFFQENQKSKIIFQGTQAEVIERWNVPVSQLTLLNSEPLDYTPLGVLGFPIINSNSAYRLFSELMGFPFHKFSFLWFFLEPGSATSLKKLYFDDTHAFGKLV